MINAGPRRNSRSALILIGAALCGMSLVACGSSTPNAPSTTAPPAVSSAVSTSAVPSTAVPSTAKPSAAGPSGRPTGATPSVGTGSPGAGPSGAAGGTTTLTGTIEAGVESGCFVLVGQDGTVLANLIGIDTVATPAGSVVDVTGTFEEDMMTTCQQGTPLRITTIEVG